MGDLSSVIIEELDGDKRSLTLKGPALPFQGASWKTKQAVVTTWYPGNSAQATQQVLGAQELPSSWEGVWRRTLMGKAPSTLDDPQGSGTIHITHPATMRDLLDDIFFKGSRLRVTWNAVAADGTRGSVVREGRATEWEFPHERIHDIQWKVTFEWYGRGAAGQRVISTRDQDEDGAQAGLIAAIEEAVAASTTTAFVTSSTTLPHAPTSFNLGQLEALANAPNAVLKDFTRQITKVTSTIKQVSNIANTVKNMPFAMANTVLSSVRNTLSVCHRFVDVASRTPVELQTTKRQLRDVARTTKYYGQNVETAYKVARAASVMDAKLRPLVSLNMGGPVPAKRKDSASRPGSVVSVHVARQGETLATISQRFYGTPDHAVDIARANHLPWHLVSVSQGKVLLIPALSASGVA